MNDAAITGTDREMLRRLVLAEPDGFSDPILALLRAMGFGGSWAKVSGARLSVFIGGDGKDPVPELGDRLVAALGGHLQTGWSPGDRWWEWHWQAPLGPGGRT